MRRVIRCFVVSLVVCVLYISCQESMAIKYPSTAKMSIPKEEHLGVAKKISGKKVSWKVKKRSKPFKSSKKKTNITCSSIDVSTRWDDNLYYTISKYKNKKWTNYYKKNRRKYKQRICRYTELETDIVKYPRGEYALGVAAGEKSPKWVFEEFYNMGYGFYLDPALSRYEGEYSPEDIAGVFEPGYGITLRNNADSYSYHEIGHFISHLASNAAYSQEFIKIFEKERYRLPTDNAQYGSSSCGEFFAEAYKGYILKPNRLLKACPKTYSFIEGITKNRGKLSSIQTQSIEEGGDIISCGLGK